MEQPTLQSLKYGIIYVMGNPKQTHNLKWFASMIEPMIRPLSLAWVETWDYDHTLIVARRFNVGNIGKYATVQLHLNQYGRSDSYSLLAAVHAFSDCLEDVMDASEGDVIINEQDYNDRNEPAQGKWGHTTESVPVGDVLRNYYPDEIIGRTDMTEDGFGVDPSITEVHEIREDLIQRSISDADNDGMPSISWDDYWGEWGDLDSDKKDIVPELEAPYQEPEPDFEIEELYEYYSIEEEYERDVKDLRARIVAFIAKYHKDPQQMMTTLLEGKVLLGTTPGHVLVNGDMKIVLPEYDEIEIKMPAMSRTLYILFMKLRKLGTGGIVLKNIDQYRDDIIDIYNLVKPGADDQRIAQSVKKLCAPLSDSLNQAISRANRCIKSVISDKKLVEQYMITGTRGEEYYISLDPELMELPRAVTEC